MEQPAEQTQILCSTKLCAHESYESFIGLYANTHLMNASELKQ